MAQVARVSERSCSPLNGRQSAVWPRARARSRSRASRICARRRRWPNAVARAQFFSALLSSVLRPAIVSRCSARAAAAPAARSRRCRHDKFAGGGGGSCGIFACRSTQTRAPLRPVRQKKIKKTFFRADQHRRPATADEKRVARASRCTFLLTRRRMQKALVASPQREIARARARHSGRIAAIARAVARTLTSVIEPICAAINAQMRRARACRRAKARTRAHARAADECQTYTSNLHVRNIESTVETIRSRFQPTAPAALRAADGDEAANLTTTSASLSRSHRSISPTACICPPGESPR